MKNTAPEETLRIDPELDDALAAMAEEVPPLPADFHDRWMSAVRAEAEKNAPADKPVPEESPSKAPVSLARWTRSLSVAAVFVLLIGGTLLYRNSKKTLSLAPAAEMSHAVMAGGEAPAEDGGAELRPEAPAVMGITDAEEAAQDMAMEAAYEEAAMAATPAEDAETPYIRWEQVRPLAFQLIKGKVPPQSFSLALVCPAGKTKALLAQGGEPADEDALPLLFLNIRYREEKLMLTTGVSEKTFRPHSGAGALWDRQVRRMLEELGLGDAISEP